MWEFCWDCRGDYWPWRILVCLWYCRGFRLPWNLAFSSLIPSPHAFNYIRLIHLQVLFPYSDFIFWLHCSLGMSLGNTLLDLFLHLRTCTVNQAEHSQTGFGQIRSFWFPFPIGFLKLLLISVHPPSVFFILCFIPQDFIPLPVGRRWKEQMGSCFQIPIRLTPKRHWQTCGQILRDSGAGHSTIRLVFTQTDFPRKPFKGSWQADFHSSGHWNTPKLKPWKPWNLKQEERRRKTFSFPKTLLLQHGVDIAMILWVYVTLSPIRHYFLYYSPWDYWPGCLTSGNF